MSNHIQAEISIPRKAAELYIDANRAIERRLGKAPGAEVLMSLVLEREDPMEFAEEYCDLLLQPSRA